MLATLAPLVTLVQTYHPPKDVISETTLVGNTRFGDPIRYDPVHGAVFYGSEGPGGTSLSILVVAILATVVVAIVGIIVHRYLRGTQEVAKAKYEALGKLAERGALESHEAQRVMPELRARRQPAFLWRVTVFGAWLTLLAGILCFILAGFARGRAFDDLVMGGVICCFIGTAIFATPIMFRELRKQGVV